MATPEEKLQAAKELLARNVKTLRLEVGLSQEQLALEAGIDRTYISQLERKVSNPSLFVLIKLADRLNVNVVDLLSDNRLSRGTSR